MLIIGSLVDAKQNDTSAADKVPRIAYDKIEGLPETLPKNITGELYKSFQPYFQFKSGCLPYAAINSKGEVSSGLEVGERGSDENACRKPKKANIYVRSDFHGKGNQRRFAIQYAVFMPRDATYVTKVYKKAGHIFDWVGPSIVTPFKSRGADS